MSMVPKASAAAASRLLTPTDHTLLLVDHQSQMAFGVQSIPMPELRNNASMVAKTAAGFRVSTIVTSVAAKSFSGPIFYEVTDVLNDLEVIDRTTMNAWEEERVINQINRFGKRKIVLAGLWTSVCISDPALSALEQGFDVYVISDACGDISADAHERGMQRMIQAGAQPITSLTYLLELQRDWARAATYDLTTGIAKSNGGTYGVGIVYAKSMFGGQEGH